jgi:hypothetical protein
MRTERLDEVLLQKYLLGTLSEEEQVQIEDHAFSDPAYMGAIEAAEADLIDAYVREELPPQHRRQFESRFFTSAQRRNRVEFARALERVASESKVRPPVPGPTSAWRAFLDAMRGWNPALQFAAGMAALIMIAGVSWLAVQNASMHSRVAALESERRDAENRERELRQQLAQEQVRAGSAAAQPLKENPSRERTPLLASIVLLPNLSRAAGSIPQIMLGSSEQLAHLEIQIESRDEFPRFRVELRTLDGADVMSRGNLTRQRSGAGYVVSFDVPASALPAGEYELTLKGVADDQTTDIGYYYFRVQRL